MIERYWTPEMQSIWSRSGELTRLHRAAVASAMGTGGSEMATAVAELRFTPGDWAKYELRMDHDIAAFVEMVRDLLPDEYKDRWHRGRTSSDLVETALADGIRASVYHIAFQHNSLVGVLAELAFKYRHLPTMGRTHGQIAEPTSLGRRFAVHAVALSSLQLHSYALGKMSGPVGANPDPMEVEVLSELELGRTMATQIVPRSYLSSCIGSIAAMSVGLSELATTIRRGSQEGIGHFREVSPASEARGSSSMPHKRNPIRSERAVGLCKLIRSNAFAVMEAGAELWDERDISHSSVERLALVDCLALAHFVTRDLTTVMQRLHIDHHAVMAGVDDPTGASALEALITEGGMSHQEAYGLVRQHGPTGAVKAAGVIAFPPMYDPESEPHFWESIESVLEG